ncbi:MAG: DUF2029 domain-containing protein [Chitinophagaceae bacterium]|nr:DUF2029 domain-containing protein [Chitinophagaceae bacterium]
MRWLTGNIRLGKRELPIPVLLWFLLAAAAAIAEISRGLSAINNYEIFAGVFRHTRLQQHLYIPYPSEYVDSNHYGPLFSILIAPFALLPDAIGCFLWCIANAWVLFYAIRQLNLDKQRQNIILLIALVEMMTAIHNVQFNPMLTGWIVLSFVLVEKEKDFWACFFIVAGFLVKVYGIAGIAFFCFSKHKIRFIVSFLFWLVVLFCLPMPISSPAFIWQSYKDWFQSIVEKNAQNVDANDTNLMQDISVMGMIRRIGNIESLPNFWVTVPAAVCYALPFLRSRQYRSMVFRISYLCLAMIGVVIFSSSAESSTFVIAVTGIGIWYAVQPAFLKTNNALLILVIVLTSLSATDLFPPWVRDHWIRPYSLKALPCFLAWCVILWQLLFRDFNSASRQSSAGNGTV